MKDIVTFETAKRLRDAGFPQAVPGNGQFWYNEDKDLGVLGNCISATFYFTWCSVGDNYDGRDDHYENTDSILKEYIFAPTATDILRELPGLDFELVYSEGNEDFAVHQTLDGDIINSWNDENPAELMAKPYLHLKNKK